MSGLTYKYPSCESVTDEYAGHIIQILKQEGGDSELLVDQFANRLAYRSVKSGLQEAARTARVERSSQTPLAQSSGAETSSALSVFLQKEHHQGAGKKRQRKRSGGHACKPQTCARAQGTCRGECSELDGFSTSLARSIARDARRALTAPAGGRPQPAADSCCREQPGRPAGAESPAEPAFPEPLQPSLQSHGCYHCTGGVSGRGCGESVIPAVDQGAGEVPGDTLELSPGPAGVCASESAKAAGGTACAPPAGQACRRCDHRDRHDRGGSSAQHLFRQDARSEPLSDSKLGHICQKPRIFHLDVPHVHVDLDKKTVLAEKIVAEAIERAERELSAASVAAGSGSGQEGVGFAESLTSEIMASAMAGVGRALSRCVSSFVWVLRKNGKVNPARYVSGSVQKGGSIFNPKSTAAFPCSVRVLLHPPVFLPRTPWWCSALPFGGRWRMRLRGRCHLAQVPTAGKRAKETAGEFYTAIWSI